MIHRRQWHLSALSVVAGAVLLVACGGSEDELKIGKIVSFGDSLSDLGTYAPATSLAGTGQPPFFGGRFTNNTHTGYTAASNTNNANIWVEWVSAKVGVPITQAVIGFATTVIPCPAAATAQALASSCTGYGQGGSRVTDPNGIGKAGGALTFPVVTQVGNHLARFTSFGSDDIVFVWAGNNDVFIQFGAVGAGLPVPTALANLETAANELVALVKDQMLAKGAKRVAVMTLPNAAESPAFRAYPAESKALLAQMSANFNATLAAGLSDTSARFIDMRAFFDTVRANPATYGFSNVTDATCDPAKIQAITGGRITDGSSLFCNATTGQPFNGMKTGASGTTWAFADGVHPTTGGHKAAGDYVITSLKDFGWIPPNL
jgi:outer membrane lipase/esterase